MGRVLLLISISLIGFSCDTTNLKQEAADSTLSLKPEVNSYTTKFAGNYMVKSDADSLHEAKEIYILKYDGTAKWMFVDVNQNIPLDKAKYGTWRVNGYFLDITYQEDNNVETEQFVLQDGCFYDKGSSKRYLQLTQLPQVPL